ncbi:MAG: glycosyltransferase family 39 protein [Sandaracinaceae bacterium]|nr:glycosyltransferase family 39 protein [Sandaracinaceae bacterium]
MSRPFGARDHLVGLVLATSYIALLLASSAELGMSRDEGFYVEAANRYAVWFEQLFADPSAATTREAVQRGWEYNHEHPSLVKSAFALSHLAHQRWDLFPTPSMAYRFPGMLSGGLLLWLIYVFAARAYGRQVGVFAALAFALMPRIFYHSQLDCFDVPIAFALTAVAYCWWRSVADWRWAIPLGVVFGLALETKHNAWTMPAILWAHWVFVALARRSRGGEPGWRRGAFMTFAIVGPLLALGGTLYFGVLVPVLATETSLDYELVGHPALALFPIPLYLVLLALAARLAGATRWTRFVPWGLLAMAVIGPLLFVALWPWMWFDTAARFREYAAFHLNHVHYNMAYLGVNYFQPPLPVSYPWVMTLFTVPLVTLALALSGIGARARALLPPGLLERVWPVGKAEPDASSTDVLVFGMMLAPLVVISMPWTPIFGGTKHWFPAYPFLAMFAGIAFVFVARAVRERLPAWVPAPKYTARLGVAALLLAPAAIETIHSHPFGLSHYTYAAGGVPGAADHGMNRQFWGFTTGSLTGWFNEAMPSGGTVWICDTTWTAWRMLQQDGLLSDDIRASGDLYGSDYAIVHHEHHFVEVDYQIWAAWGRVAPAHVLTYDGVPIISVYENPRRAARRAAHSSGVTPVR